MAMQDQRMDAGGDWESQLEYNEKLFKGILRLFVEHMPAVHLADLSCINQHLVPEVMEQIRRTEDRSGSREAARLLLDHLWKKPGFFDSILEAMDYPDLRLTEFKPMFMDVKECIDKEWLSQHTVNNNEVQLRHPTQDSMEGGQEMTRPNSGRPISDFNLVANPDDGAGDRSSGDMQRDSAPWGPGELKALSNSSRDFDAQSVHAELSSMPGWSDDKEDQEIVRSMRKKRDVEGTYLIFYNSSNQRPALCVIYNSKELTFRIHKSVSCPGQFFINKSQHRCGSLTDLINYHILNGIRYKPSQGKETTVHLTAPYKP